MLSKYAKAVVAFVGTAFNYLYIVNSARPNHWVTLALGVLTVLGVHQLPNTTPAVEAPVANTPQV